MTRVLSRYFCLLLLAVAAPTLAADEPIFPKDAKLELLFTRSADIHGGLTEGPSAAPDGSIYFSDIPEGKDAGMILRFDPKTMKTSVFTADSGKSNGLRFDAKGDLLACEGSDQGGRRVSRWNIKTGKRETVADKYMGKRFNAPNDCIIDAKGRIYFSDPRYLGTETRELDHRAVYRIDSDGKVSEVTHDVEKPNGIALSPDDKMLYLVDHNNGTDRIDPEAPAPKKGAMKIYSYPLNDGVVSGERKTLVDFGTENGCDGMRVDSKGRLFMASRSLKRPGIMVIDSTGKELAFLPTTTPNQDPKKPVGIPSNCEFGIGDDSNMLYVTIDTSLYRVRVNAHGFHAVYEK